MKKIVARRNDIAFYLKIFALVSPDQNQVKSVICSNSLSTLEKAFEREQVPSRECASTELEDNMQFAEANGITAAPALIFPDGSLQLGFSEAAALEKTIDEAAARRSAGK